MIQELLSASDFERIVDDGFANYVMQTAVSRQHVQSLSALLTHFSLSMPKPMMRANW